MKLRAAAQSCFVAAFLAVTARGAATIPFPMHDPKAFRGVSLRWTADNLFGDVFAWLAPTLTKETGLTVDKPHFWATSQGYEIVLPQLLSAEARWDLLIATPQYLGDFVETGGLQPLDDYFRRLPPAVRKGYWDDVLPVYREFYTRWNGKTYAIPLDGDILALHYRPSFFRDSALRAKFKAKFKRDLAVPETWDELDQVAQFFTEELKSRDVYGIQIAGTAPWVWAYWYPRAAADGVGFFTDEMEPGIHTPAAVSSLEKFVSLLGWAPPGIENLGGDRLVKNWQAGRTVMALWYFDLTELGGPQVSFQDDVATAPMPGVRLPDGTIRRFSLMPYGRVALIPKHLPEKRKLAAFYAAFRASHPDVSSHLVADSRCGMDPFLGAHFDHPEAFLSTNPYGSTQPIYKSAEQAKRHLEAGRETTKTGFPQPTWPGAAQYLYALGTHVHKAILKQEKPEDALRLAADEWKRIRDRLGRQDQRAAYRQFQDKLGALGLTLPGNSRPAP